MPSEFFCDGLIPTLAGLNELAERVGYEIELDDTEPGYWARPTEALQLTRTGGCVFEPILPGGGRAAARSRIGNWLLRMSAHIGKEAPDA